MNKTPTILAVDDTTEALALLATILTPAGYQVRLADSGELALAAVAASPPDLILLDVRMKGMDGFEVCRRLKACEDMRHIPIILISAVSDVKDWVKGLQLGAADYIAKPFQPEELLTRVKTHLSLGLANASLEQQAAALRQANEQLSSEVVMRQRVDNELRRSLDWAERSRGALLSALEDQRRAEENLRRQTAVTAAINRVLQGALHAGTDNDVARICLSEAEKLTGSKFGWIGEVNRSGRMDTVSLSDPGWEACGITGAQAAAIRDMEIRGIFGRVLKDGKSLIANDPGAHPDRVGLPIGHPELTAFLGVPLKRDGRAVGMIALGNKPSGYASCDQEAIETLSVAFVGALQHSRAETERERLAVLIESTPDFIGVADPKTTQLQYINKNGRRMCGLGEDEDVGKLKIRDVHPAWMNKRLVEVVLPAVVRDGLWEGEGAFLHRDGREIPVSMAVLTRKGANGDVDIFYTISRDISERKRLEAQFLQAQKMETVGRLAGGVAHDFNNLLTVINGTADLALTGLKEGAPLHTDLQDIRQAGERGALLTRQLLAFSRKQIMTLDVLNLSTLVADLQGMLQRLIGEHIALVVVPAKDLGSVMADPTQIEQVVMNLAVNARDAMPNGGTLTIETRNVDLDEAFAAEHPSVQPGPHVMLAISDTGTGMDEATRAQIFEPFFTTKDPGKGTGLGLSTVYGIVKQSGWTIWVYSEPGKGATFKIYLPRVEGMGHKSQPAPAVTSVQGTETILVVEDEEAVRRLAKRVLQRAGYTVLAASNGAEALLLLARHDGPVHLMLTDMVMPGMSGRELVAQLEGINSRIKVLCTSGYTDEAILRHGLLDETAHFIGKPYNVAELTRKVREVLDGPA